MRGAAEQLLNRLCGHRDGLHGLIDLIEGEGLDGWDELDLFGYAEEVAAVLAGHIGYAAELALAP